MAINCVYDKLSNCVCCVVKLPVLHLFISLLAIYSLKQDDHTTYWCGHMTTSLDRLDADPIYFDRAVTHEMYPMTKKTKHLVCLRNV